MTAQDQREPKRDIDFMRWSRYCGVLSLIVCALIAFSFYKPGPRWGTDFKGGTEVEIGFTQPIDAGDVRAAVESLGFGAPDVVKVEDDDNPHRYLIRVQEVSALSEEQQEIIKKALCVVPESGPASLDPNACPESLRTEEVKFSPGGDKISVRYLKDACGPARGEIKCPARDDIRAQLAGKVAGIDLRAGDNNPVVQNVRDKRVEFYLKSKGDQIMDGLRASLGADKVPAEALRTEWIGPKAGRQLRDSAIKSIAIALVFIMAYVAFRFDIRFAPGGILALIHDVLIAAGAMILTQREVTISTIAALLTIVGFSINDTVVIYDRIRELLGIHRHMTFPQLINRATTEMLGRTFKTSLTVLLALAPFMFIGTGVIKDFAFTMTIGMLSGVYSTIYIAAPFTEWLDRKFFGATVKKKRRIVRRSPDDAASRAAAV